jgi:large subunit ribosomal protein L16
MSSKFNPPRQKFRKTHTRPLRSENETRLKHKKLIYGTFGIQTTEAGWITPRHLECIRVVLRRALRRKSDRIWFRVWPSTSVSAKSRGIRMGKGKGLPKFWIIPVKANRILIEVYAKRSSPLVSLKTACSRLPMKTKIISCTLRNNFPKKLKRTSV